MTGHGERRPIVVELGANEIFAKFAVTIETDPGMPMHGEPDYDYAAVTGQELIAHTLDERHAFLTAEALALSELFADDTTELERQITEDLRAE